MYTPISNRKLKQMVSYLILSSLHKKFDWASYSLCFYTLLWLRYLLVSLMPIKGLNIANIADNTTIVLGDIRVISEVRDNSIQVIFKLCEDASSSKINFSKSQASAKFLLKYLEFTLVTPFSINPNGTN